MIKTIQKNRKYRFIIYKSEKKKKVIKSIVENYNYLKTLRWNVLTKLYNFPFFNSKTCLVFKCILKGSKKTVNKFYHYSRHTFLKLVRFGIISGLEKASW
jgi:ribosomal protein S14